MVSGTGEGSGRGLIRNTAANGVGRVVNAALAVVLTPFLLGNLGAEQYGVWLIATMLTFTSGYLSLAELGFQQVSVRLVAEARHRNDDDAVARIIVTTTAIYTLLGSGLAIALVMAARPLSHIFDISPRLEGTAALVFLLVGLQIAIDLPAAAVSSLLEGAQQYGVLRVIDVGSRVAWAATSIVLVGAGHGVVALAAASVAFAGVALAATVVCARRLQPSLRFRLSLAHAATARRLARDGAPMLALRVLAVLYSQMDRAIVGLAIGAAAVARYEVPYKIHAMAALMLGVMPSAVMPATAYIGQGGGLDRLERLYVQGTKYALALGVPVSIAGIVYARPLIRTWVGVEYTQLTGATRLLLVYPVLAISLVVGQSMLIGLGRMSQMLRFHAGAVGVNLAVSVVLVREIGLIGVIWGTICGHLLLWVPFTRLLLDAFGLRLTAWLRLVVVPVLPGWVIQVVVSIWTLPTVDRMHQLWQVGLAVALSYAVALSTFAVIGLDGAQRSVLVGALRRRAHSDSS